MKTAVNVNGNRPPEPVKLEIRSVSKRYRRNGVDLPVLEDFSLSVRDREFLVLLGPSGCGKSTLLRMIDGIETCDAGSIVLDGMDVANRAGMGRAMVFQSFELFPWRTVIDNIMFGLELNGTERAQRLEIAQQHVKLVGLSGFERSYPYELSGGMQQRVGIARALAVNPSLLLMDEPYGALDVQTRDVLQDELLSIWEKQKKTVIFVTHSIEEAIYLADRIVVMSPRPTSIERLIDVPFERPRSDVLKGMPEFIRLRQDIWAYLKQNATV